MYQRKKEKGFTLIELMIVVAIIAILAVIAIPLYTGYVRRAKISEAITGIDAIKSAETVYFQTHGSFVECKTGNGQQKIDCIRNNLGVSLDRDANRKWDYSTNATATAVTITATATSNAGSGLSGGSISLTGTYDNNTDTIHWGDLTPDGNTIKQGDLP